MKTTYWNGRTAFALLLLVGCGFILVSCSPPVTVAPVPREYDWWQQRFNAINERVKQGNVGMVFIGDSITQGWEGAGAAVWDKYYANRNAVNLGIGGDCTQQVLWRLENGNTDGISPKVAVVLIGTNNFDCTAKDIALGVEAIVKTLRKTLPNTRVLLLAIFPRGDVDDKYRQRLKDASARFSELDSYPMVDYMDIGNALLDANGVLQRSVMPDLLHPGEAGYQLWAEAIEPRIVRMLAEKGRGTALVPGTTWDVLQTLFLQYGLVWRW